MGFCTADFLSSLVNESAEQKPKHYLSLDFPSTLLMTATRYTLVKLDTTTFGTYVSLVHCSCVACGDMAFDVVPTALSKAPTLHRDQRTCPFGYIKEVFSGKGFILSDAITAFIWDQESAHFDL